jgi:hypothetical protein
MTSARLPVGSRVRPVNKNAYPHLADATLVVEDYQEETGKILIRYTRPDGTRGSLLAFEMDFMLVRVTPKW